MIFLNHLKVVARFGRFPHRNVIMERASTKEETAFLNDKAFRFDLPLHYDENGKVVFEETEAFNAAAAAASPPPTPTTESAPTPLSAPTPVSAPAPKPANTAEQFKGHVVAADSVELKKSLLGVVKEWKKTLEKKMPLDTNETINKKSHKLAVVEAAKPETYVGDDDCAEITFETDKTEKKHFTSSNDAAVVNSNGAAAETVCWTRSTAAQRETRKSKMAKLLMQAN